MRRAHILVVAALCLGCIPEVKQLPGVLKQRAERGVARQVEFVDTLTKAAAVSPEPVPVFVAEAIDTLLEDEGENLKAIANIAEAQAAWQGPPDTPLEAGTFAEKAAVEKVKRLGKLKALATSFVRSKLGLAPKPGAPPAPASFPWMQVAGWGVAVAGTAFGAKKTKDAGMWKAGSKSLSRALGRLKKNGTEKKVLEATDGDDIPEEERAAGKAVYRALKAEGAV